MNLVTRDQWGARPPKSLPTSVRMVNTTVHYTGAPAAHPFPWPHSRCAGMVRSIQDDHMDRNGWSDVAYSMLVCVHGTVYEGRGRNVRTAANGDLSNATDHAICYLGGDDDPLTGASMEAINDAAEWLGTANGEWTGHRDHVSTSCPGEVVYAWVRAGHPRPSGQPQLPNRKVQDMIIIYYQGTGILHCVGGPFILDGQTADAYKKGGCPEGGEVSKEFLEALFRKPVVDILGDGVGPA